MGSWPGRVCDAEQDMFLGFSVFSRVLFNFTIWRLELSLKKSVKVNDELSKKERKKEPNSLKLLKKYLILCGKRNKSEK